MDIIVQPGTYVVAVSGGVDSMVLLDLLRNQSAVKIVVAHFDHGIRHDSSIDRELVQKVTTNHGLPFTYHLGELGHGASESTAREARYEFLHKVKEASNAKAILTAHHHDDVLETAIINLLRGTNRKGLSSLKSSEHIYRPLLHITKNQLKHYAKNQGLVWREDETNQDTTYLRNHVRHNILARLSDPQRQELAGHIRKIDTVNRELDQQLVHYLHVQPALDKLDRQMFSKLPHAVSKEVMAGWLRNQGIRNFDQPALERLVVHAKTKVPGKAIDVIRGRTIGITSNHLTLDPPTH